MNIKEFYIAIDGNYEETVSRLGSERLITRLLSKFKIDPNMPLLISSLETGDIDSAFRAVHTLKGVALNMGFSRLAASSSALTEKLRARDTSGIEPMLKEVEADYKVIFDNVEKVDL